MRIDLHMHTQKCKQGDGSKRKITPENLVNKLSEEEVGVCAITNHNKFDKSEYETVKSLNPELNIFPGIELDIDFHDERRHVVVVCNPKKANEFYATFDNEPARNYNEHSLLYEEFLAKVKTFEKENIIVIPHFMDKDRGFTIDERKELFDNLKEYVVILETSKLRTMGVVNDHEEHLSLIGSDVKDWTVYSKDVLPELKFNIDSFEKFYELACDAKNFVKNVLKGSDQYLIAVDDKSSIAIFDDINVIFGEKGSGKTILLKDHIYPYFRDQGKKVFLHEGKNYARLYQEMIQTHEDSVVIDETIRTSIVEGFDYVITYSETNPQDFILTYKAVREDSSTNKRSKRIKKSLAIYSNIVSITVKDVLRQAKARVIKIDETKAINVSFRSAPGSLIARVHLDEELSKLQQEIQIWANEKHKEIFTAKLTDSFLNALKESLRKKADKKSKPNDIGFSKLTSTRLMRLRHNKELIDNLSDIQISKEKSIGKLPVKGDVRFETSIVSLSARDYYKKDSIFDKSRIKLNRELVKKINSFSVINFKNINDYFNSTEKEVSGMTFENDVIRKSSLIKIDKDEDYTPSEGEKAILSISGLLESYYYDCYLFDEVETGLGNKYISEYLIPRLKELRSRGKVVVLSTHNANIAVNTLPSQLVYCDYPSTNTYYFGNMYSNELTGIIDGQILSWEEKAIIHLEGNETMFNKRKNIYGLS